KSGVTTVTATKDGVTSGNSTTVTVTAAVIDSIQVTPPLVNIAKGQTQQLTATAMYSDGNSSDISDSVTWTPADPATATVTPAGVLTGVKSGVTTVTATKDGVTSGNSTTVTVTDAVIDSIQVTSFSPFPITLVRDENGDGENSHVMVRAIATYNDNSTSDITGSVTWTSSDRHIFLPSSSRSGLLVGISKGSAKLTASKDGVTSNTVDVNVCNSLGEACIDFFPIMDDGVGRLYTSSPSVAYLGSIGGSPTNGNIDEYFFNPDIYDPGPFSLPVYLFNWTNANKLCDTYNLRNIGGRTNWRLPTKNELVSLAIKGNFTLWGWPRNTDYWSISRVGDYEPAVYYKQDLEGDLHSDAMSSGNYVSCVSNF
ncbi:Ig-like domain-containing protein, partial [Vibrio rumoiensis]|uniref:Ig-like domain-containing protein n=1 Tax=Vibrio rumoiensis TaxID=76258 RepID=UPI003AA92DFF